MRPSPNGQRDSRRLLTRAELRRRIALLSPEDRAEVVLQMEAERRDRAARPLAYAKLWHRDAPRTSQRTSVEALLQPEVLFGFLLGGNRSGKSDAGAQIDAAFALGRDHPDVREWARRNHIDVSGIQPGPGRVWTVARTDADSRRYVRPKVAKYLPQGCKWRNRDGDGESEVTLPNGGYICFKSVKQGRDGMQGDAVHVIRFDEEPRDIGVVEECLMRLADFAGRMLFTMTPLYGWTELLRKYVERPAKDTVVRWLHGTDNPHVPRQFLEGLLSKFGKHQQAARQRGEITALEGRVYDDFSRHTHVVPAFRPPTEWRRYSAIDFGARNPTAVLWAALDEKTDTLHIYAEHYKADWTMAEHAAAMRKKENGHPEIQIRWADPEGKQQRLDLVALDIATAPAIKSVDAGINAVCERLRLNRADGRPGLVIHDCCVELLREIEAYVWDEKNKPRKENDHAMDCLRYLCMGLARLLGRLPQESIDEAEDVAA